MLKISDGTGTGGGDDAYTRSEGGIWIPRGREPARKPTAVDLFCGCGGFSLGFIQAGFEVVCGVDRDVWSTVTYLSNLGQWPMRIGFVTKGDEDRFEKTLRRAQRRHEAEEGKAGRTVTGTVFGRCGEHRPAKQTPVRSFLFGDMRQVTGEMIRRAAGTDAIDAVIGGPPCQGFSTANRNRGPDDPRNPLVFEFARLIVELNPRTFVMENVPEIASMRTPDGMLVLDQFQAILDRGGYETYDALEKLRAGEPKATVIHRRDHALRGDLKRKKPARPKPPAATPLLDAADA